MTIQSGNYIQIESNRERIFKQFQMQDSNEGP